MYIPNLSDCHGERSRAIFCSCCRKQRVAPLRFAPVAMTYGWESVYTNKGTALIGETDALLIAWVFSVPNYAAILRGVRIAFGADQQDA